MRKIPKNGYYATFNNRQHKNPSPEEIEDKLYAFTFNPTKQPLTPQFKLDLITWHNGMDNIFKDLRYSRVELRPELSQGSRWHYHGRIKIEETMKFFIYDLPVLRANGSYEIDTISDETKWIKYISKQEELMKKITKEFKIPYIYDSRKTMKVKVEPLNDTKFTELIEYEDSEPDEATSTPKGGETG